MANSISWNKIHRQFVKQFPLANKHVLHWCPSDHLTIKLYLDDGSLASYNYLENDIRHLEERWKE